MGYRFQFEVRTRDFGRSLRENGVVIDLSQMRATVDPVARTAPFKLERRRVS